MRNEIFYYVDGRKAGKNTVVCLAGITYPDPTYEMKRLSANIYVFEYVIDGEGVVFVNGVEHRVKKGDVYILKKGEAHFYYSDKKAPMKKIWFNVDGDIIAHLLSDYGLNNITHIAGFGESELFYQIRRRLLHYKAESRLHGTDIDILFHMLIKSLSDFVSSHTRSGGEAEILKEYIDSRLEHNITVQELARVIYRSVSHTINIFKNSFGKTPYDYMLERRVETAKLLLKNTGMKISEVCRKCGFSDLHYFSRYFKKRTGFTPKEYRAKK